MNAHLAVSTLQHPDQAASDTLTFTSATPDAAAPSPAMDPRFRAYRETGDRTLRDQLIGAHLHLATIVARQYASGLAELEDLTQVASLGLLKALTRFDPDHGAPFAAFALTTMRGEALRYLRDTTWQAHVPRSVQELDVAVRRASNRLSQDLGRSPRVAEIARAIGCTEDEVIEAIAARSSRRSIALESLTIDPTGAVDAALERVLNRDALGRAVSRLSERAQTILYLRFIEGLSQRRIADQIGVSQMQVSRLLRAHLGELRELLETGPAGVPERRKRGG